MPDLAELNLRVNSKEPRKAAEDLDALTTSAKRTEKATDSLSQGFRGASASAGGLSSWLNTLYFGATALASSLGILGSVTKSLQISGEFEQTAMAMETLLGSQEKAVKMMEDIVRVSASTPFEVKGLSDSVRMMLAYGFASERVIPMLLTIGDATSAMGGSEQMLQSVVRAFGQIQAKGRVSGQEMNQLAEQGISAWRILADAIGVSIPEAMKMAENGAIKAAPAIEALLQGMDKRFTGSMAKQSQTLLGVWSTFKDSITITLKELGDEFVAALDLKTMVVELSETIKSLGHVVIDVVRIFAGLSPKFDETAGAAQKLVDIIRVAGAVIAGLVAMKLAAFLYEATTAMWAFTAAVAANPVLLIPTLVTAAIGAIVTALVLFKDTEIQVSGETIALKDVVVTAFQTMRDVITVVLAPLHRTLEAITGISNGAQQFLQVIRFSMPMTQVLFQLTAERKKMEREKEALEAASKTGVEIAKASVAAIASVWRGVPAAALAAQKPSIDFQFEPDAAEMRKFALANEQMQAQMQALVAREQRATLTKHLKEANQEMDRFVKDHKDAFKTQEELNRATEEYGRLVRAALRAESLAEFEGHVKELETETALLKFNTEAREHHAKAMAMEAKLEQAGLKNVLDGIYFMRRYTSVVRELTRAKGEDAAATARRELQSEIDASRLTTGAADRARFRAGHESNLKSAFGPQNADLVAGELDRLMALYDEKELLVVNAALDERTRALQDQLEVARARSEIQDRLSFQQQTLNDLTSVYKGDVEKAKAALADLLEIYDQINEAKANETFRLKELELDRQIQLAGMGDRGAARQSFIWAAQDEALQAYTGDIDKATAAVARLTEKFDELQRASALRDFTMEFASTLQRGIEDALWNAVTQGDWKEALSQVLMQLARQSFSHAFNQLTSTQGGSSNVFMDIVGSVFGAPSTAPQGGGTAGASAAGAEAASVVPKSMRSKKGKSDRAVLVFNVPDASTASSLVKKARSADVEAVVARGSGAPGINVGTLRARRRR